MKEIYFDLYWGEENRMKFYQIESLKAYVKEFNIEVKLIIKVEKSIVKLEN